MHIVAISTITIIMAIIVGNLVAIIETILVHFFIQIMLFIDILVAAYFISNMTLK